MTDTPDLIVVGAGIIGLATAYLAYKEGRSVMVIDAADRVVGSSIQNFGHACFTAQADSILPVVHESRAGWIAAAHDAGFLGSRSRHVDSCHDRA